MHVAHKQPASLAGYHQSTRREAKEHNEKYLMGYNPGLSVNFGAATWFTAVTDVSQMQSAHVQKAATPHTRGTRCILADF
jgi:hypothetical protein